MDKRDDRFTDLVNFFKCHVCSLVCSEDLDELFSKYANHIRKLYELYFSDDEHHVVLHGVVLHRPFLVLQRSDAGILRTCFPQHNALFIHKHYSVTRLQDSTRIAVGPNVCFTAKEIGHKRVGLFSLVPSCQTVIANGDSLLNSWNDKSRLLFSEVMEFNCSKKEAVVTEIYALPSTLALVCKDWPLSCWTDRHRQWPSADVVMQASAATVYLTPARDSYNRSTDNSKLAESDMLWQYDFCDMEELLWKSLNHVLMLSYAVILETFTSIVQLHTCLYPLTTVIMYGFFWTLEKSFDIFFSKPEDENAVLLCKAVYDTVVTFAHAGHFPHYFIPEINVMCGFVDHTGNTFSCCERCGRSTKSVRSYVGHRDPFSEFDGAKTYSDDVRIENVVVAQLTAAYGQVISLINIQLYQRLHSTDIVDLSIEKHCQTISRLEALSANAANFSYLKPLIAWISSSLGIKYHVKAISCELLSEKQAYLEKAFDCLTYVRSTTCFSLTSAAYLLQFLIANGRTAEALAIISSVINLKLEAFCYELPVNPKTSSASFEDSIMAVWYERIAKIDVYFTVLDKPVVPKDLNHCSAALDLLHCQVLGCGPFPVAALHSRVYVLFLAANCLASLNRQDDALVVLSVAEKLIYEECTDDVFAEKSPIVCLSLLASVYREMGSVDNAMRLYRKSSAIMKNPRNPAHWDLTSLKIDAALKKLVWPIVWVAVGIGFGLLAWSLA